MKNFKLMAVAFVAILGLTACNNEPEHIYDDHSADLAGTWTCLNEGFAEALVIKADGSMVATGFADGKYWDNVNGTITLKDGKAILNFDDNVTIEGHFDIIPGMAFSIVQDNGERVTFDYCESDLADEIVGMWVCHEGLLGVENDMAIFTYSEDGKMTMTTQASEFIPADFVNVECDYKVIGDIMFTNTPKDNAAEGNAFCQPIRLTYTPNGTTLGDIYTQTLYAPTENGTVYLTTSWLRIKQTLELAEKKYDYSNIYITNVKAKDAEFEFAGQTLNLATMDGKFLDKMMKNILFSVSFPSSDEIVYNCYYNGESVSMPSPIVVDGNKMTIKKSANNPAFKDIDVWAFQDQDNTQMHMYMPTTSFEKFFGNVSVAALAKEGKLDVNDADAVAQIYASIEAAIETINISFIFKDSTRAL